MIDLDSYRFEGGLIYATTDNDQGEEVDFSHYVYQICLDPFTPNKLVNQIASIIRKWCKKHKAGDVQILRNTDFTWVNVFFFVSNEKEIATLFRLTFNFKS